MAEASQGRPAPGAAAGTRRLMIREMVLDNFKSYAGPQRVGPFHKSFSSVVGPNGSGKSNVIDAMLFVFGRRAKQLRFNKVSELIHNSTNFRNLEMAKVTVHFQEIIDLEGEAFEVIPGTNFTVARTAHRNNTSDYYINDRKVSTKEVTDKLKGLGIDLDNNRFLILQGEVEQISMMKPKAEDKHDTGLLEYLEDIIGTDKYVAPIEESSKKLEEINDKRQTMVQRLKIAEKEKEGLEGKKAEAELFLSKQGEMLGARINGTHMYISAAQANLTTLEDNIGKFESKLAHEREKYKHLDEDAREAERAHLAVEKEYKAIQKELEAAQEEQKGAERRFAKMEIEHKNLTTKLAKVTNKIEADAQQAQKLEAEVAAIEEDAPRAKEQLATLQQELANSEAALEAVLEGIRGEVEGYHTQLSAVRGELAPWEKKIGEVSGRVGVAVSERDMLARKAEDAKKRLDGALKSLAAAQQSAQARERQIKDIEAATQRCKQQIETHRAELSAGQAEEARLEGAVKEARERVAGLRADVNGAAQQSGLVVALMTAKAKGEVSGVFGRLGDLGAIDAKYDVAVSTAVGALDYIVVETASDAQRCVEFLRRNNLGVATFLILEKQRHLAGVASEKLNTPEGVPRLYDLVKVKDDRLRPAFFYAMGNTLVAEDLDQATRIAYGGDRRFRRVVTLQGQLIAESGTMSGGGGKPMRGRMTLGTAAPKGTSGAADAKAAAAELRDAEQQLEKLNQALRAARDQVTACEQALRAAERQLNDLETAAPKARMEAKAEADKAADIQQRLEELRKATEVDKDDAARIAELSLEIAREERKLSELRAETAGLEKQVAALQAKIDNAGGDKLRKAKAAVAKLQKDIQEAEADATKKAVQVKASAKQAEKLRKDSGKDVKEKERLEKEIVALEGEIQKLIEATQKVEEATAETQKQLEAKKVQLDEAKKKMDELFAKHSIIRKVEENIVEELGKMKKMQGDETKKVGIWEGEIGKLQTQYSQLSDGEAYMVDASTLEGKKADDFMFRASVIEAELEKMNPDMGAIEEYRAKAADYASKAAELDAVTAERDQVRRTYEGLRKSRLDEFMAGFNVISLKLKEMYQMITLGGDAELELVDSLDPFSEGIVFSVRPPRKSWKNISNLSGGEKTLSSLSLVFALHHYKPTPLYVMDEIDAALDFKNVSIVGHYIKERTRNAQFVIISLRNNMFELADRLVGIYKTDNTTKTVTINPGQFVLPSAAAGGPAGTAAAAAGAAEDGEKENQGAARAAQGKHGAGKGAEVGASPAAGQRLVSVA